MAIAAQISALIVWPLISSKEATHNRCLWCLPVALALTSMRWWENYASTSTWLRPLRALGRLKAGLSETRYHIYMYLAPLKIVTFLAVAFVSSAASSDGIPLVNFFTHFSATWESHSISVFTAPALLMNDSAATTLKHFTISSSSMDVFWLCVVHAVASWLFYVFAKFACKVQIQSFSLALPANLTVPVALLVLLALCAVRATNACALNGMLPAYLFVRSPDHLFDMWHFVVHECSWLGLVWWLSQAWIVRHMWTPQSKRNSATERLFVAPMFQSLLVEQCVMMNRQRDDREAFVSSGGGVTMVSILIGWNKHF